MKESKIPKRRLIRMYLVNKRQQLGLSQTKVAMLSNISRQHYSRIENGDIGSNIYFRTINNIAHALAIPISLIWEEECKYQELLRRAK